MLYYFHYIVYNSSFVGFVNKEFLSHLRKKLHLCVHVFCVEKQVWCASSITHIEYINVPKSTNNDGNACSKELKRISWRYITVKILYVILVSDYNFL